MSIDDIDREMRSLCTKIKNNPGQMTTDELGSTLAEAVSSIARELHNMREREKRRL